MFIPNQTELIDAYKKANASVKDFIASSELRIVFEELRTKHKLHFDEAGALSDALNAVFLELVPLEKFPELVKEVVPDTARTQALVTDINEKVFVVFREYVKNYVTEEKKVVTKQQEVTPTTSTTPLNNSTNTVSSSPLKKLEESVQENAEKTELSIQEEKPTLETQKPAPQTKPYSGTDPYREPVE